MAASADAPCMQDAFTLKGGSTLNCTANDLSLTLFHVTGISESCTTVGDTWTFSGAMELAPRTNFRYDLGFYISHDGIDALTGTCTVGIVDNTDVDNNAGTVNLDGDVCGDFTKIANSVPIGPITATCTDRNADGHFDLQVCAAYAQSAGSTCNGITDAVPGTASKCQCASIETDQVVPQCTTNADCPSDGNPCDDEICGGVNTDLFGCGHANNSAPCNDGLFCNGSDTCTGGSCSAHAGDPCTGGGICGSSCNETADNCFASAATVCRSSVGICDLAETCTGTSATCPANGFSTGNTCRSASGICDVAETCSGLSSACPADSFASTSVTCRASSGECDVAEVCSGGAATCPADASASAATPCTSDGNVCTDDLCNGSGTCAHPNNSAPCNDGLFCNGSDTCTAGTCGSHAGDPCTGGGICGSTCNESTDDCYASAATVCRASAGVCDVAENCTGGSVTCPADSFSSGNTCRGSAGICDVAETCSGASASCPADGFASNSFVCRAAAAECDAAETCSGGPSCPADALANNTTPCSSDSNVCTDDFCDGSGTCAHTNNTGPCDDGTFCNGADTCLAGACTVHPGDPCGAGVGACSGTCNEATDACDGGDGNACDDSLFCNGTDTCAGGTCSIHTGDPCAGGTVCQDACNEAIDSCNDPNGAACTSDGNVCTDDECDGAGTCAHNDNTAPCNDDLFCNGPDTCAAGACTTHTGDPCTGGGICGSTCNEGPDNCFASGATVCRAVAGVCDVAENCTGASASCPADAFTSGGTCRGSAGVCDVAETCSGTAASCPADGFASGSVVCRAAAGECDVAENCSGVAACPADAFASSITACSTDLNGCTDDLCNGSGTCAHTNNTAPCDDGSFCNGVDTCAAGTCSGHAGDPCAGGGECANTCDDIAQSCFSDSNTSCTDDSNECTDDFCNGFGTCAHTNNSAPCDDGTFCNGSDTCAAGSCSVHPGDPCLSNPFCSSFCDEAANDCNNSDDLECGDECTDGQCVDGQCVGEESLLSPSCRWIVVGGVGPVTEGNTVKTTGVRNDVGSYMNYSACGFYSKSSRGVTGSDFVVTAGFGQGVKGFGIKFSAGAGVVGNIVTAGSGMRATGSGKIPGTEYENLLFGYHYPKLDEFSQPDGTYVDTTNAIPIVVTCDNDQDKLAAAVPVLNDLPTSVEKGKFKVKPDGLTTLDGTGLGVAVFNFTSLKVGGRAQFHLEGGPTDVVIIRSGDIKIAKGASVILGGGLVPENVLFYGKGRRCQTGRQVTGFGTWFCPAARKFQVGTGATWTGTWMGGVKDVRIKGNATLTHAAFTGL